MGRKTVLETSPVTKTLKWKGEKTKQEGTGKSRTVVVTQEAGWYYWDKEKEENIQVEKPFSFLWLETAYSISGFDNKTNKGVFSNEVLKMAEQELEVKSDGKVLVKGIYKDIKETIKGYGGKYTQAVYVLADFGDGFEVARLLMSGSSNEGWSDLTSTKTVKDGKVTYKPIPGAREKTFTHYITFYDSRVEEMKTGSTYDVPMFKFMPAEKADLDAADEAYETLVKPWFEHSAEKAASAPKTPVTEGSDDEEEEEYPDND